MSVRAKFLCKTVEVNTGAENEGSVILEPVISAVDNEENDQFFRYTPDGRIEMSILNPSALSQFEAGKEYYVDFSLAS